MRALALALAALWLSGCARDMGGWFEPPMRRTPRLGPVSPYARALVNMNDTGAEFAIARDIEPHVQAGAWRWTGKSPALKLQLTSTKDQKFVADFTVVDAGLAKTGPLQVAVTINGRPLTKVQCAKAGPYHIEQPVPSDWLNTQLDNFAVLDIDKTWRADGMDHDYGIVLTRAGFRR